MSRSSEKRVGRFIRAAALAVGVGWACLSPPAVLADLLGSLTVNVTSPADGATVTGTTTVTASVTVVGALVVGGVQFKLDGANLGAEDTQAPYSVSWNTTTATNGKHTLTAVGRSLLGLRVTSAPVTVTVANDVMPPVVNITAPTTNSTVAGTITVSADASDNVGVKGVQFKLDGANLGAEDTTAPYSIAWDTTGAADATHTLTAVARDAAGNIGTSVPVSVKVANAAPTPPATTVKRFEETDPSVSFDSNWVRGDNTFAWSGGTAAFTRGPNAQATFNFNGTRVSWIGWREMRGGIARVFLDGALVATVDLFSATAAIQEPVFTSADLAAGDHTLVVEATGTKNALATDTIVVADAFDVTSSSNPPPPPPPSGTVTRFEEFSPSITYTTGWNLEATMPWSGGMAKYTASIGSQATFNFTGTGVSWIGYRGHFGGFAKVVLDGVAVAEIDTYLPADQVSTVVYSTTGLAAGQHTLTVELLEKKNPAASSTEIAVDAFDVRN
ncbi:MAG: Ig-like domain-containing protein [Sulfurifustis sp.]